MARRSIRVTSAEYVKAYEIRLRFSDGAEKTVDFSRRLNGEVFKPLRAKRSFRSFFLDGGTVCWPNGADIAPETLYLSNDVAARAAEQR